MSAYTYTQAEVEALLPGVWDSSFLTQTFMGGSSAVEQDRDPRHTYDHIDGVIDVKLAFKRAGLTLKQKQALLVRYGLDETERSTAHILGIAKMSAREAIEAGLKKLVDYLNSGSRKPDPRWANHPLHRSRMAA